ncbi:ROK family protein [Mesorhizobium sp. VK22B]|uniref:ROK family protein n=1 Tax=Mesorhizobium captivum TaxID=3072319 RepID=A0ABU4ZBP0_9HYPH|nr:ROK family protein [Mesorhizobium sp. VK22B]MDX8496368.1 ROK family protein [Mesorhizobium sp. VK22B]
MRLLRLAYGGDFTVDNFIARAKGGDIGCRHVLADVAGILGRAIAGAWNILNPEVIVVAGDFLPAGELFVQPLRKAISRHTLIRLDESEMGPTTELLMASFGGDASAFGAVA